MKIGGMQTGGVGVLLEINMTSLLLWWAVSQAIACEQALCLGKNSQEREVKGGGSGGGREPFRFSLSTPRLTKGLFTG